MHLTLDHDYRYAVEQMALTLFPDERFDGGGTSVTSRLSQGASWATATAVVERGGVRYHGRRRVRRAELTDGQRSDRLLQKIIKLSFFDAGVAALGRAPVWGALTGVRPAKFAARLTTELGESSAVRALTATYRVDPPRAALAMDCARAAEAVRASLTRRDILLYVGIPFCPTRCAYCSFVSADVARCLPLVEPFMDALFREIAAAGQVVRRRGLRVIALYIGGGTPTTLSPAQLTALLDALHDAFDLSACRELTVEAGRPDTLTPAHIAALRGGGADRISVNPQTMRDEVLRAIGRAHTAADTRAAWQQVGTAGFAVRNMDFIAGLPGDSPAGFADSLSQGVALAPENITIHTFARKRGADLQFAAPSPAEGDLTAMTDAARELLRAAGYLPYYLYRQKFMAGGLENVGWCKPGSASAYNIAMMEELCSVLALGGGGVTKIVRAETGEIRRINNPKYPAEYIDRIDAVIQKKEGLNWRIS